MPRSTLAVMCVSFACLLLVGCAGSPPVAAVTTYTSYNSPDGAFEVQLPDGWEVTGNAGRSMSWAKAKAGAALVSLRADAKASLLDDAGGGRAADRNALSPELAPVHDIHEMGLDGAPDDYGGYQETPAGTQVLDCPLGPARFSEFTASGSFGGALHGYRATAIGHKMGVHVVCVCNESDWTTLKPAFDHVLTTLRRGVAE